MTKIPASLSLTLPAWVQQHGSTYSAQQDITPRMDFVIKAARENINQQTGGPFAAAIFEQDSGKLISVGVNIVTKEQLSIAHAEILAISLAQQHLQSFSLARIPNSRFQLVSSSQPCAMCLGAISWSGISSLVCGALAEDARAIGFDEGPIHPNWQQELEQRGIATTTQVLRQQVIEVLRVYQQQGGDLYNANKNTAD